METMYQTNKGQSSDGVVGKSLAQGWCGIVAAAVVVTVGVMQ